MSKLKLLNIKVFPLEEFLFVIKTKLTKVILFANDLIFTMTG